MSGRVVAQKPDTSLFGAIFLFVFATVMMREHWKLDGVRHHTSLIHSIYSVTNSLIRALCLSHYGIQNALHAIRKEAKSLVSSGR